MQKNPTQVTLARRQLVDTARLERIREAIRRLCGDSTLQETRVSIEIRDSAPIDWFPEHAQFRLAAAFAGYEFKHVVKQHRHGYEHWVLLVRSTSDGAHQRPEISESTLSVGYDSRISVV